MAELLKTDRLTMRFGGLSALNDVNLVVGSREIVALIGPNGAGKTTFFNCITGIYTPTSGDVLLGPPGGGVKKINGLKPNQVTALGMARTFQNIRLFQNLTVLENVMVGRHCRTKAGIWGAALRGPRTRREERETTLHCHGLLEKFGLEVHVNDLAKNLPYGAQRRLEIVRAMATDPFLLLLDEPAAGMNIAETKDLVNLINRIRSDMDVSILLIEHDMSLVMSLSDRIYVMDYGLMICQGDPECVQGDPRVIKAYLGEDDD
ncbi:MAG: ABC transporter ATP-binding protein [Pseudomonadota bacterium]